MDKDTENRFCFEIKSMESDVEKKIEEDAAQLPFDHRPCDPPRLNCLDDIICSQSKVAECEAKLFCEIASRLGWEIKHARCMRDLEHLLYLANNFLSASANKEKAISEVVDSLNGRIQS